MSALPPSLSLNPDASPAALTRRPLGACRLSYSTLLSGRIDAPAVFLGTVWARRRSAGGPQRRQCRQSDMGHAMQRARYVVASA